MKPARVPKVYRPLAKQARRQHWTIRRTGGGHLCWRSPSGRKVFTPSTPSEYRGLDNAEHQLRDAGLHLKRNDHHG